MRLRLWRRRNNSISMHTEAILFSITGRVPSKKNSKQLVSAHGRPLLIPSKAYLEWEEDACWQLKSQMAGTIITLPLKSCSILLTFTFPDHRIADLTNKAESVMDALVKMRIIEDDNWKVVPDLRLRSNGANKEHPGVEIILYYEPIVQKNQEEVS